MKKELWAVMLGISLVLTACETKAQPPENNEVNTDMAQDDLKNTIVSVSDFKKNCGLHDGEIPDEYIEEFIDRFRVTYGFMEQTDYLEKIRYCYGNETNIGYSIMNKIGGPESTEALGTFAYESEYIFIQFEIPSGEASLFTGMVIDFKHNGIYYGYDMNNYSNSECSCELEPADKERICTELVSHIHDSEYKENSIEGTKYYFRIWFIDAEGNHKQYSGDGGDEFNFPGLDEYIKDTLFREYLNMEFKN